MPRSVPPTRFVSSRWAVGVHGFTLMELLVAVSVLALVLVLVGRIFQDTTRIVSQGSAISKVIGQSRTISDQLLNDSKFMLSYESGLEQGRGSGFLVIVQHAIKPNGVGPASDTSVLGVRFPEPGVLRSAPDSWSTDQNADGAITRADWMRSDQLVFLRRATDLQGLTPGLLNDYNSDARAKVARVWYGHLWPVESMTFDNAGNVTGTLPTPTPETLPGDEGYNLVTQMILGRQATLLVEDDGVTRYATGRPGTDIPPSPTPPATLLRGIHTTPYAPNYSAPASNTSWSPPTFRFDTGWRGTSDVMSLPAMEGSTPVRQAASPNQINPAYPDWPVIAVNESAKLTADPLVQSPQTAGLALFWPPNYESVNGITHTNGRSLFGSLTTTPIDTISGGTPGGLNLRLPTPEYAEAAASFAYIRTQNGANGTASFPLGSGGFRLRGAVSVEPDFSPATPIVFPSPQLAMTHPVFARQVSDFAVEFAADFRDDYGDYPPAIATAPSRPPGTRAYPLDGLDGNAATAGDNGTPDNLPDGRPDMVRFSLDLDVTAPSTGSPQYSGTTILNRFAQARAAINIGEVKWYTDAQFVNNPGYAGTAIPTVLRKNPADPTERYPLFDPYRPVTWPLPEDIDAFVGSTTGLGVGSAAPGSAPNTISPRNFRYTPGLTGELPPAAGYTGDVVWVWSHSGDAAETPSDITSSNALIEGCGKYWPYMLRIRYRLHDGNGSFHTQEVDPTDPNGDSRPVVGRWFEQIIPVPRPAPLY